MAATSNPLSHGVLEAQGLDREEDCIEDTEAKSQEQIGQIMEESSTQQHSTPPLPFHPRHTSSKYDFVKVRVWLGDNADHYYVLSRFLVSRMLTVTKIPNHVAIKISLELKKLLIDNSLLDVSQSDLEANLFKLMERRGYGEEYINRYKMMTRFHHQRVPLVILVCGTASVGKSTIATQLAQRLNLPNVLQTDMVYELLRTSTDAPLTSTPIWEREFASPEELVTEFCRECRIVRKGLDGDLKKAMKDGKPIIIEGIHLDPSIYLTDEENGGVTSLQNKNATDCFEKVNQKCNPEGLKGADAAGEKLCSKAFAISEGYIRTCMPDEGADALLNSSSFAHVDTPRDAQKDQAAPTSHPDSNVEGKLSVEDSARKQTSRSDKSIVILIVLKMEEFDHKMLLEEWITCRSSNGVLTTEVEKEALISKLMTIQDYLCSFESQGVTIVNISATTFPQTLDWLHSYLLQCIEDGCASQRTKNTS